MLHDTFEKVCYLGQDAQHYSSSAALAFLLEPLANKIHLRYSKGFNESSKIQRHLTYTPKSM